MKNNQLSKLLVLVLMAVSAVLNGCTNAPLTPSQTVEHFWSSVISGDIEKAGTFSTPESISALDISRHEFANATVTFGKVNLESTKASVETMLTLQTLKNEAKRSENVTAAFDTLLEKKENHWRVNYIATSLSIDDARRKKGLSKLVDDLGKLGRNVSGQIGGVLKHWEQMTPEIKRDLESLGNSVQRQLQESVDKHGPELQKKLQDFTESLDGALKDLEKELPQNKKREETEPQDRNARMI